MCQLLLSNIEAYQNGILNLILTFELIAETIGKHMSDSQEFIKKLKGFDRSFVANEVELQLFYTTVFLTRLQ